MSGNNGSGPSVRTRIQITVLGEADVLLEGKRLLGTTKYWKGVRGHAYCPEINADVYVYFAEIDMEGHKRLEPGQDIEFTLGRDEKGLRAYNVKPLRSSWTHWTNDQWETEKQPA